jgi:hypothetical protein
VLVERGVASFLLLPFLYYFRQQAQLATLPIVELQRRR